MVDYVEFNEHALGIILYSLHNGSYVPISHVHVFFCLLIMALEVC